MLAPADRRRRPEARHPKCPYRGCCTRFAYVVPPAIGPHASGRWAPRPICATCRSVGRVTLQTGNVGGRLRAALEIELCKDRTHVVLDGLVRQEHLGRDLLVRLALRHERKDLAFLLRQRPELVRLIRRRDPPHPFED